MKLPIVGQVFGSQKGPFSDSVVCYLLTESRGEKTSSRRKRKTIKSSWDCTSKIFLLYQFLRRGKNCLVFMNGSKVNLNRIFVSAALKRWYSKYTNFKDGSIHGNSYVGPSDSETT